MPHGYCFLWDRGLLLLHVISDCLIAVAYFSIPITLAYFVRKRRDLPVRVSGRLDRSLVYFSLN
jgi:two-component system NtrC family sensor kinase